MTAALLALALAAPSADQARLIEAMKRVEELRTSLPRAVFMLDLTPHWNKDGARMWYRRDGKDGLREFVAVDCLTGVKSPLFDHDKLTEALGKLLGETLKPRYTPLDVTAAEGDITFSYKTNTYIFETRTGTIKRGGAAEPEPEPALESEESAQQLFPAPPPFLGAAQGGRGQAQPRRIRVQDGKLVVQTDDGKSVTTEEGDFSRAIETPNGKYAYAWKLSKGDRREVYLVQSSPREGGRAVLRSRMYDLPGDKLDSFSLYQVSLKDASLTKLPIDPVSGGGQPWAAAPNIDWVNDGEYGLLDSAERGYQRVRVYEFQPAEAKVTTIIDESSPTFIDTTAAESRALTDSRSLIWRSEKTGWGHYYLVDRATGAQKAITSGEWVTRGIRWVDEAKGEMCFMACGKEPGQDPYQQHAYIVSLDGSGLRRITDGDGNHTVTFSPDRQTFVDSWSRVDAAPVHHLRRTADGKLLTDLETADVRAIKEMGVALPVPFVAKARDGKTDIWGVVCLPSKRPKGKLPIIENIYAGPQDSFVPKRFFAYMRMQQMADLGFAVVQIDGMGTRNRGKAFHDVCWKNLADAGFPDRILWMKALAKKMPFLDIDRVGVYGTSAGGQNSTAAMLFHPEFYKVGVSSCGCHDNRMDKVWWNEQWMGYPVGPHYSAQSNITNASKLQGKLMLIVGELDTNVPPESTYRLVDALEKAGKNFEFVVIPGADHTDGGPYGDKKRRDFFIRNLLGFEPPAWGG